MWLVVPAWSVVDESGLLLGVPAWRDHLVCLLGATTHGVPAWRDCSVCLLTVAHSSFGARNFREPAVLTWCGVTADGSGRVGVAVGSYPEWQVG